MRNIKKALFGAVLTLVLIIGIQTAVRCCYEDWDLFTVNSRRERTQLEGQLDTLYCGTSLTYHAFLPELLDELLGTNSFNLGTASQPFIGSYYLLRETVENNPVNQVYVTVSLPPLLKKETETDEYLSAFEFMRTWKWKLAYLNAIMDEDVWTSALFYSTQVKNYFVPGKIKENLVNKYLLEKVPKLYRGRGYRGSKEIYEGRQKEQNSAINRWSAELGESQLMEEGWRYLEKIVEFCNKENIEVVLLIPPFTQDFINGAGDMEAFEQFIADKAAEWKVKLYDFIRYKERESIFTNEKFMDSHHMNNKGAETFCRILAEIEQSEDPQEYFNEIDESED